jgi:hypothetical protein
MRHNPFYVLLLLAGCAFAVTACAYGVMTVRDLQLGRNPPQVMPGSIEGARDDGGFGKTMDEYGPTLMLVELVLLAIGTFGAMAFDRYLDAKSATATSRSSSDTNSDRSPT